MRWIKGRKTTGNHQPFSDEQIQAKVYELWKTRGYVGNSTEQDRQTAIKLLKAESLPSSGKNAIESFGNKDDREFALKVKQFQWERLKTIISALGLGATAIAAIGLFITYKQGEERLVTDRFAKAVEQLGSPDIHVRIGAIYSLGRIAKDSPRDQWTVMNILSAYVRNKSPLPQGWIDQPPKQRKELPDITLDVQSALTVIGNRDTSQDTTRGVIDLGNANLQGANLIEKNFQNTSFDYANLQRAFFYQTNLQGVYLHHTDLSDTDRLTDEQLSKAEWFCKTKFPKGSKLNPDRDCSK